MDPKQIASASTRLADDDGTLEEAHAAFMAAAETLANVASTQAVTAGVASLREEGERIVGEARTAYRNAKREREDRLADWEERLKAFERAVGERS